MAETPITKQLRKLIKKDGRTVKELSVASGVGYSNLHGFLNDPERDATSQTIIALAKILGYSLELKVISPKKTKENTRLKGDL